MVSNVTVAAENPWIIAAKQTVVNETGCRFPTFFSQRKTNHFARNLSKWEINSTPELDGDNSLFGDPLRPSWDRRTEVVMLPGDGNHYVLYCNRYHPPGNLK